jgi:hypothetical protein
MPFFILACHGEAAVIYLTGGSDYSHGECRWCGMRKMRGLSPKTAFMGLSL